jgi:hypothetical protein
MVGHPSTSSFSRLSKSCRHACPGSPLHACFGCGHGLPVTFRTPENYRTESIVCDVAEVNLHFNAIISRPALYQFMAITHYGYLVLKMPSPNGIIKICGDCSAGISALEKLQTLVAAHEVTAGNGAPDQALSISCQCVSSSTTHVQPLDSEDVAVKIVQICADAS